MIHPLLQKGSIAHKLGTGLERLELVTGGMNDREARYTDIPENLPPAQQLALVRVQRADTKIRVPANFCARLRCIEAFEAVFRLEEPRPSVAEAALFKTDQVRARTLLDQTPNLERLTIDGLRFAGSDRHTIKTTMDKLYTIGFRVADLNRCPYPYLKLASAIQPPTLHKHILIDTPDTKFPMSGAILFLQLGKKLTRWR